MMEKILLGVWFLSEGFILSSCLVRQYFFIDQSLNWTEAQTYCRQKHVDLATTENATELTQLVNTLSFAGYTSDVWIGLFNEVTWKWSNGSGAEYMYWDTSDNEPDFYAALQFCVAYGINGRWKDEYCGNKYSFICYNGTQQKHEFIFVNTTLSWSKAQKFCRDKFVDLAIIRNETDNLRVQKFGPFAGYSWIGLYRDPIFNWSDGSSFLFSNWDNVYNVIGLMKVICGVTSLRESGTWEFLSCERKLPFMCYSLTEPISKKTVKLRLKTEDSVDLNDVVLKENILKQLQGRMKKNQVGGVTLKWREKPGGEVFQKEKKFTEL